MARWSAPLITAGGSFRTTGLLAAAASSPRRAKLIDVLFGSSQAPADNEFSYTIQRTTSIGSGGVAVTPGATDQADTLASTIQVLDAFATTDPAYAGVNALIWAMNQRASARWIPVPFDELIIPATANNGFGIGVSAATTTNFAATVQYEEL